MAWTATASAKPAEQLLAAWHCTQSLPLPAPDTQLAACRRTAASAAAELKLLLITTRGGGQPASPRELVRLRDATRAELRLFVPPEPCRGSAACLTGLVLVDQRDESSCYGTQVLVLPVARPARSIGFIDEMRAADGQEVCIGPIAQVNSTRDGVRITVPGPLLLMGRDGTPRPLAEAAVDYHISVSRPSLQRQPPRQGKP